MKILALILLSSGQQLHLLTCLGFTSSPSILSSPSSCRSHHQSVRASHPETTDNYEGQTPLFLDATLSTASSAGTVPPSIAASITRVKQTYLSGDTNYEAINKGIVQVGMDWSKTKPERDAENETYLQYPEKERVPGCIATVHLQTTLIPTTKKDELSATSEYRVSIEGTSDALLSGGLLAILSQVLADGHVNAYDILDLDSTTMTTVMGLQTVLSRGRNDGMASMIRVIQNQIRFLLFKDEPIEESMKMNIQHSNEEITNKPRVAMLLSGGVDSSVALHLLLKQNYNVTAFYLRIWLEDELAHLGECPWEDDLNVCQAVCEHAGNVPLHTVSLGKEYRERVVQYTIDEAKRGRTPNPDINCNSRVKFGCFLEYIENNSMEFDYVASGHYARIQDDATDPMRRRLFRAPDPIKDQSYFLCVLTQKQLSKVIFPIGNYQKSQVRQLAAEFELPNRNRPDSQGLCFLGKVKFDDFIASYLGKNPGDIIDALNGEVIGHHNGLWYHTVGQRKGIGPVLFPKATAHGPWYVVAKDQNRNIVFVSNRYDEDDFIQARSEFEVDDIKWISGIPPKQSYGELKSWNKIQLDMKIRHGPKIVQGALLLKEGGTAGNIRLEKKDGGLAPGQYVVFYEKSTDECLGAGVISEKHWANFLEHYDELTVASNL
jgi:tRNA-specific 2-thiouridylase